VSDNGGYEAESHAANMIFYVICMTMANSNTKHKERI